MQILPRSLPRSAETRALSGKSVFSARALRPRGKPPSIQPLLLPQTAKARDMRQRKRKPEQIFVANIGDGVAPVLHGHAAAIPVVGCLRADELQLLALRIHAKTAGRAESTLVVAPISECRSKLIEAPRSRRPGYANRTLHWNLQESIAAANRHLPNMVVGQQSTGVHPVVLEVEI